MKTAKPPSAKDPTSVPIFMLSRSPRGSKELMRVKCETWSMTAHGRRPSQGVSKDPLRLKNSATLSVGQPGEQRIMRNFWDNGLAAERAAPDLWRALEGAPTSGDWPALCELDHDCAYTKGRSPPPEGGGLVSLPNILGAHATQGARPVRGSDRPRSAVPLSPNRGINRGDGEQPDQRVRAAQARQGLGRRW